MIYNLSMTHLIGLPRCMEDEVEDYMFSFKFNSETSYPLKQHKLQTDHLGHKKNSNFYYMLKEIGILKVHACLYLLLFSADYFISSHKRRQIQKQT